MKKLFLTFLICFCINYLYSQSITPNESSEQCPGVNVTFAVTIPNAQSIVGVQGVTSGTTVVQQPFNISNNGANISFSFIGKFGDWNQNQTFKVTYTIGNNLLQTRDFTFTKIKSLLFANSYSTIYPYPLGITAPLCQSQTFNIQFTDVKYGNINNPSVSYGSIIYYEYQLPIGWKLGTTISNGSNWIAGGNNVTVTSDLGSGNGQYISVRPINSSCGLNLTPGQASKILISRPAPTFQINGPLAFCNSANYSISNLPAGATITWSVTGNNYNISGSNTANPVTVQRTSNDYGVLTANITTNCGSYTATKNLVPLAITFNPYSNGSCGEGAAIVDIPSGNNFFWEVTGDLTINGGGQTINTLDNSIVVNGTSGTIAVTTSACGSPIYLDYNYEPYKKEIIVAANPMIGSDPLSASIQNIDFSYTEIKWYIDGVYTYNLWGNPEMFFDTNNPPCGTHTLSAKAVLSCGATVDIGSVDIERYCSWWRIMTIYPNPASSYISIQPDAEKLRTLSNIEKSEMREFEAAVYNVNGKLLLSGKSTGYKLNLDTRSLRSDNYFIHIKIDGEKEVIKKQVIIRN